MRRKSATCSESEKVTFYVGFDPTADSLHIGHFMQLIVMKHMQNAGHRPIILLGGGTTMVGDPTGKADMRPMITQEVIQHNADNFIGANVEVYRLRRRQGNYGQQRRLALKTQLCRLSARGRRSLLCKSNADGECFKTRMERGLSFLEFNHMPMQGIRLHKLHKEYNCKMEFGGDDQWSNILGGIELIRRK